MKLPETFRNVITDLGNERPAHVLIDGALSAATALTREVQKRVPLSPYLFVLQMMPICNLISELKAIFGAF